MSSEARNLISELTEAEQADYRAASTRKCRYLTPAQVADYLGVSRMTVYRMCHSGELPAIRVGRQYRIPCDQYAKWVLDRPVPAL